MTEVRRTVGRARRVACVLALCALVLPLQAIASGAIPQLREFIVGTQAARGEFSQMTLRGPSQRAESASGVFAFARPGRFRWEVRKPFEQLVVSDGERVYQFDRDLNQVTVRKLAGALDASPAAILFGSGDLDRAFVLKEAGTRDGLDWLDAAPRSRDAGFERILLGFRGGLPEAMEVVDAFGVTTRFTFRAVERGARVEPALFRFVPPKGVDLVEQ